MVDFEFPVAEAILFSSSRSTADVLLRVFDEDAVKFVHGGSLLILAAGSSEVNLPDRPTSWSPQM